VSPRTQISADDVASMPYSARPGRDDRRDRLGFLKRLLGGERADDAATTPFDPVAAEAEEREHELDVLRGEQERLDDLAQRQLRYAQYAWQPPAQGGERRADDGDRSETG
jgi:hypothetical protein